MSRSDECLSNADFAKLRDLIYTESGINLGLDKKTMVELRLKRRIKTLELSSYAEYCHQVFRPQGKDRELVHLIDAVTTNKTDFFREAAHFEYLVAKALPALIARHGLSRKYLVWSAGCSTGEEPYTLAMVLSEYAETNPGFHFSVLATDVCTSVLDKARHAIFRSEVVDAVPPDLRRKYFMRSRDRASQVLRVVPELRELVEFRRVNFMDADFGLSELPGIIFCRNVIIYFDRQTQVRLLGKLTRHLEAGGYFFSGHSESLQGMNLPLVPAGPSVYKKVG